MFAQMLNHTMASRNFTTASQVISRNSLSRSKRNSYVDQAGHPVPTDELGTLIDTLSEYGCWCSKYFSGFALSGQPLDTVDKICSQWNRCTRCENRTCWDTNDFYTVFYDV